MSETQDTKTGPQTIHIRVPKVIKDKLKTRARNEFTSVNALVLAALVQEYGGAK